MRDMSTDERVTVTFGHHATAGIGDAVLYDGHCGALTPPAGVPLVSFAPISPHNKLKCSIFGCLCGTGRDPAALALSGLFMARARGEVGYFNRVIADVADVALVRSVLEHDLFVRARFRLP